MKKITQLQEISGAVDNGADLRSAEVAWQPDLGLRQGGAASNDCSGTRPLESEMKLIMCDTLTARPARACLVRKVLLDR